MPARQSTSRQALSCTGDHRALRRQQHIMSVQLPAASEELHGLMVWCTACHSDALWPWAETLEQKC